MKTAEAIRFLVEVTQIDVSKLIKAGQPTNVADLGHVAGLAYELCRFAQASRWHCDRLIRNAMHDPEVMNYEIGPVRQLIKSIADREDYRFKLVEGSEIRIFAPRLRPEPYVPLPFVFWSPRSFAQALVITATIYLGHSRDVALIRRCRETDCGKLFVAVRRSRLYCSHECASAASQRAYQQRQRIKEKRS